MGSIRRLTHNSLVVWLARLLHISGVLKRIYWLWTAPPDRILSVQYGGWDAQFHVRTPEELRILESPHEEEHVLRLLLDTLETGDVVYDIGSNIGQYTVVLAKAVGKTGCVVAFEPQRDSYDALVANVKLNGPEKVQAYRKALGEDNRAGELLVKGTLNRHSNLLDGPGTEVADGSEDVDVVRGDDFVLSGSLPLPWVVKVDVEGYEYHVLRGV